MVAGGSSEIQMENADEPVLVLNKKRLIIPEFMGYSGALLCGNLAVDCKINRISGHCIQQAEHQKRNREYQEKSDQNLLNYI